VSFAAMLWLVLVAVYALTSLLLSILVAAIWRVGLGRMRATSSDFLALRLLPTAGAALLTFTVVLPAFLSYEPAHELEAVGPFLVALAVLAVVTAAAGVLRGWRAVVAGRILMRSCGRPGYWSTADGQNVDLFDIPEPIVAVVGGWRPRIIAAKRVLGACSPEEFHEIVAHEAAHVSARDNLKLLLFVISPDVLAWLPCGATLAAHWRAAAEFEADEHAAGSDPRKRVALASALIKVARLATGTRSALPALSMSVALDDVEGRVRQLLSPSRKLARATAVKALMACSLLVPVLAVPLYGLVHLFIEGLVALGR
jgi:Zn-dependent protease with chaperone function